MYANLVLFKLGPGMRSAAEQMSDQFMAGYKAAKGFVSITFLGDHEAGEYGNLSLWESMEALAAFNDASRGKLQEALAGIVKGPPTIRVYEVYEPKT